MHYNTKVITAGNRKTVLVRSLKETLDGSFNGYGFIPRDTIVEVEINRAKDLVARGIFAYVRMPEDTNYFYEVT